MVEKAMEKLTAEMAQNEMNPYVQVVGQHLIAYLEETPEHASEILSEGKTILKSLDVMRRYAETKRVGNVTVLTDAEGFAVVLQYFGCWQGEPIELPAEPEQPVRNYVPTVPNKKVTALSSTSQARKGKAQSDPFEQTTLF